MLHSDPLLLCFRFRCFLSLVFFSLLCFSLICCFFLHPLRLLRSLLRLLDLHSLLRPLHSLLRPLHGLRCLLDGLIRSFFYGALGGFLDSCPLFLQRSAGSDHNLLCLRDLCLLHSLHRLVYFLLCLDHSRLRRNFSIRICSIRQVVLPHRYGMFQRSVGSAHGLPL